MDYKFNLSDLIVWSPSTDERLSRSESRIVTLLNEITRRYFSFEEFSQERLKLEDKFIAVLGLYVAAMQAERLEMIVARLGEIEKHLDQLAILEIERARPS